MPEGSLRVLDAIRRGKACIEIFGSALTLLSTQMSR